MESRISFVVPDDARVHRNVQIPSEARQDATSGQLVVCEITQPPTAHRPPSGRVLAVLGDKLTASLAVEAALHRIGRASCRERVCQYVSITGVAGSLHKKPEQVVVRCSK